MHPTLVPVKPARLWRAFREAAGGNVTITFAVAMLPMLGLVGAALDYSRANAIRTALQAAADSTALAAAKDAPSQTAAQLQSAAQTYFNALFTRSDVQNVQMAATYSSASGSQVAVTASATMKTAFMGLFGVSQMPVGVSSTSAWGMSKIRVALVLDNTGSMSDAGKIGALKTASHQFLQIMQTAAQGGSPGDVQVAIIPFNTDVNIGTAYQSQAWLDWTFLSQVGGSWSTSNWSTYGSTTWSGRTSWSGSTWNSNGNYTGGGSGGGGWGGGGGGGWTSLDHESRTLASLGGSEDDYIATGWSSGGSSGGGSSGGSGGSGGSSGGSSSTWSGCVMDRDQDYDVLNTAPSSSLPGTYFPADNPSFGCPVPLMPLSYDWTALNTKIDAMTPGGNTNQTIGLAWGWLALTPGGPLGATAVPAGTQQVMILLTDGLNTQNRFTDVPADIDARTLKVCTNIKAAGIMLYTVQVNTGSDPVSIMLQKCATDSGKNFVLTTSGQIVTTFNQIGTNLSHLRVAK